MIGVASIRQEAIDVRSLTAPRWQSDGRKSHRAPTANNEPCLRLTLAEAEWAVRTWLRREVVAAARLVPAIPYRDDWRIPRIEHLARERPTGWAGVILREELGLDAVVAEVPQQLLEVRVHDRSIDRCSWAPFGAAIDRIAIGR